MTEDLTQIIQAARQGDESAFRRLIESQYAYVHRLAYRVLLNTDEANDAAQETFIKVWQNLTQFRTTMNFRTWLYRIASNTAIDLHRKRSRRRTVGLQHAVHTPTDGETNSRAERREIYEIVRLLLSHLPPVQRLVFALRDVENLPLDDISTITGISPASVRTNLSYARRRMRELLDTEYDIRGTRS